MYTTNSRALTQKTTVYDVRIRSHYVASISNEKSANNLADYLNRNQFLPLPIGV
jgi:hypothetical protein